jgi:hypothetical protein
LRSDHAGELKDSGGIPGRFWNLKQNLADSVQHGLDRAAPGPVHLDAVLALHDADGDLEVLEDHGGRLGLGEFGMDQDFGAQGVMQPIGGAGEEQAQVIGEAAMSGGAITGQIVLDPLDPVLDIPLMMPL